MSTPPPPAPPVQPPALIEPGAIVGGRYRIEAHLGQGGFAQVYRAVDQAIDRAVAVKVLALGMLGTDRAELAAGVARFRREAQAAGMISHPNVVTIHDVGTTDGGEPYIVMEYLSGHDLQTELTTHGPMKPSRAVPLFCECLDALGRAHALGIVHKDLKPENLFIVSPGFPEERLKIFDFGIAHIQREGMARLTVDGQMLGTPHYLAPEYITDGHVTPALDVYQMGLILVEVLTGYPVVGDDNPLNCVMIHGNGELEIPDFIRLSRYGQIIDRALSLEPEDRYPNAIAFRNALAEAFEAKARQDEAPPRVLGVDPARLGREVTAPQEAGRAETLTSSDSTADPEPDANVPADVTDTAPLVAAPPATPPPLAKPVRQGRWPLRVAAGIAVVGLLIAVAVVLGGPPGAPPLDPAPTRSPSPASTTPEVPQTAARDPKPRSPTDEAAPAAQPAPRANVAPDLVAEAAAPVGARAVPPRQSSAAPRPAKVKRTPPKPTPTPKKREPVPRPPTPTPKPAGEPPGELIILE